MGILKPDEGIKFEKSYEIEKRQLKNCKLVYGFVKRCYIVVILVSTD